MQIEWKEVREDGEAESNGERSECAKRCLKRILRYSRMIVHMAEEHAKQDAKLAAICIGDKVPEIIAEQIVWALIALQILDSATPRSVAYERALQVGRAWALQLMPVGLLPHCCFAC